MAMIGLMATPATTCWRAATATIGWTVAPAMIGWRAALAMTGWRAALAPIRSPAAAVPTISRITASSTPSPIFIPMRAIAGSGRNALFGWFPLAQGHPAGDYPFPWAIYRWIDGHPFSDDLVRDECQAAVDLAQFVVEL